ncbi:MAG: 1-acyl-sn-glycerol-3-phosphate acyltransferase [Erysipelotrichaceae bacterium]|nr:1-acyl-sn-glycerol-3-phosphate acyltransferase [Erysipelotrichaceae bacterium]
MMSDCQLYQVCRFIAAPLFRLYFRPKVIHADIIPQEGPIILAGNHKHALDPLLVDISTKRTVHALAKSELFEGFFGPFFYAIGAIPVDLDAPKNPDAYAKARETLLNEEVINISPEAARNYTRELLLPFKKGAVRLAKETHTRIIPYCIVGNYRFLSRDLQIVFGDPVEIKDESIEEANEILYKAIAGLLLEYKHD